MPTVTALTRSFAGAAAALFVATAFLTAAAGPALAPASSPVAMLSA